MKTIFITGVAGFIGSNLAELLVGKPDVAVVGCDDLSNGTMANIKHLMALPNFQFLYGDILDEKFLEGNLTNWPDKINTVVHLAARGSVPASFQDPSLTYKINVVGTQNVLRAANKAGVKMFLNASSSSVYGGALRGIQEETDDLLPAKSPYAHSKQIAEELVTLNEGFFFSEMATCNMRFFNVFGPRQKYKAAGAIIPAIVANLMCGEPLEIHGDGSQTRDFTYVKDLCAAIYEFIDEQRVVDILNLSPSDPVSINEAWRMVKAVLIDHQRITPQDRPVFHGHPRTGDIQRSCGCSKTRRELFNTEFRSFKEAIRDWFPVKEELR